MDMMFAIIDEKSSWVVVDKNSAVGQKKISIDSESETQYGIFGAGKC